MREWKVRVVILFNAGRITLEDLNAMIENFKRNLKPTPEDVYFEVIVEEGRA